MTPTLDFSIYAAGQIEQIYRYGVYDADSQLNNVLFSCKHIIICDSQLIIFFCNKFEIWWLYQSSTVLYNYVHDDQLHPTLPVQIPYDYDICHSCYSSTACNKT